MPQIKAEKYNVDRLDRYIQRHIAPLIIGFLCGFFTLAAFNLAIKYLVVK